MSFRPKKALISVIEIAFVVNLIILDVTILGKIPQPPLAATTQHKTSDLTSPLSLSPTPLLSPTNQTTPTPSIKYIQTPVTASVKEYFIPFGSGQNSSDDWQNVTGLQTYIDSSKYPNIKSVVFEASVHIPTGNESANVRLFNATDKHPVWFSDVSLAGGDAQFLISQPISLDPGNKLYQVQMKTQLQYPAMLDQARIHIILY
jgi:hypothetical protein